MALHLQFLNSKCHFISIFFFFNIEQAYSKGTQNAKFMLLQQNLFSEVQLTVQLPFSS